MKKILNAYCCFIPIGIYTMYSLNLQFLFGVSFLVKSMVLSALPSAIYILCCWSLVKSKRGVSLKVTLLTNSILASLLSFLVFFVGRDTESALIAGIATYTIIAFIFAFSVLRPVIYRENTILKDKNTGHFYFVSGGNARVLSDKEAQSCITNGMKVADFSSSFVIDYAGNAAVIPVASYSSNTDFNQGVLVNPTSGMPMVGGISGLDVHGNSWGTNFNEPSSTYDPNRGY